MGLIFDVIKSPFKTAYLTVKFKVENAFQLLSFDSVDLFTTVVRIVKVIFLGVFFKGKFENSTLTILTTVVKIRMFSGIPTNVKLKITLKFPLKPKVEDLGRMNFVE